MTPAERRAVVTEAQAHFGLRLATACRYLGVHRALLRYVPRLTWRLRREGFVVNPKRIARLLRLDDLRVGQRTRHRKRVALVRMPAPTPTRPDERWSMDFVRDTTAEGRPFRIWTIVDDCTRECPHLLVERSLPARRVIEGLEALLLVRGVPRTIVCDNGPEFVSLALDQWASAHGIRLDFIRPGRPVENCFIESFIGRLRDECLNLQYFSSLAEARHTIEAWRCEYNAERPHSGLGYRTPDEVAACYTREERLSSPTDSDRAVA